MGWDDEDHHTLEKILQRRSRISDLTQESILITDNKAVIEYVNPSFCRSSGYGLGEVIGITPASLINLPEDVSEMQKAFEGFQQGKNWEGIIYLRKKNGDALALNVRICPIFTSDKKEVEQYIAFATDISHERSLEKQIRELQRIESLGTLAAGVAHRFNNILASVIGHTELLAMVRPDDTEVGKRTAKVIEAAIRGRDIIAQLSQFSQQQEPQTRPVDLAHLVRHASNFINTVTTRQVRLEISIPEDGPRVMANTDDLHQVLINLFTNAVSALPEENGRIEVSLTESEYLFGKDEYDEPIPAALIQVADNGSGIPEKIQHRIFEPFFTTRSMAESSGMGLSIVHGIVQNHGGRILCESQPGKTIFKIYLPIFEPNQKVEKPIQKDATILLMAPQGFPIQSGRQLLEAMQFKVIACSEEATFKQVLSNANKKLDLVLMDLELNEDPQLNKLEVLREKYPKLPVILMVDMAEAVDFRRVSELNVSTVLHKPCPLDRMRQAIRKAIRS